VGVFFLKKSGDGEEMCVCTWEMFEFSFCYLCVFTYS
jgi:hypothetical protein